MDAMTLVVLLSPLMLLVLGLVVVTTVALCQARPEDVPTVVRDCFSVFKRIADKLPQVKPQLDRLDDDATGQHEPGDAS